ncbi:hypothetical protein Acsp02_95180 [Actinoplanes sp. NBRC 103695]|nr:hypothetical protein Acsp02_95180 [Actinoplanes sp. NBRC 103695]
MRFVSYQDRKKAAALKPIYTAPTAEVAETELLAFTESALGRKYPAAVATCSNAWERFIPFLAFPPELRKIIYTTNAIESLNYQLRKVIKNRGHFPSDDAAIKLFWLAIRDIEDKRALHSVNHLAGLIRYHGAQLGCWWRRLDPRRQAFLALADLRNGDTFTRLADGSLSARPRLGVTFA